MESPELTAAAAVPSAARVAVLVGVRVVPSSAAPSSLDCTPSEPPGVPGSRAASLERLVSAVPVLSVGQCQQSRNGAWARDITRALLPTPRARLFV